jgi:Skp family chaperone for outer membrane proteins
MSLLSSPILCAAIGLALPAAALAQSPVPADATVAYVSAQRVSGESAEGRAGQARVIALQRQHTEDLRTQQAALVKLRTEINQAASDEERTRLRAQEQQLQADLTRAAAQVQTELQNLQREISAEIRPRVQAVLSEMLAGTNVQMVLSSEVTLVWARPGLDLTDAVIDRMNATAKGAGR